MVALLLISTTWFIGEFIIVGKEMTQGRRALVEMISVFGFALGIAVFVIGHLRARKAK